MKSGVTRRSACAMAPSCRGACNQWVSNHLERDNKAMKISK